MKGRLWQQLCLRYPDQLCKWMEGIRFLLFGLQECFVELLKITLRAGTNWIIEILNSTLNIAVTYLLRGLEHTLTSIITGSLCGLRIILDIGIHYSVNFLSTLSYIVVVSMVQSIEIIIEMVMYGWSYVWYYLYDDW